MYVVSDIESIRAYTKISFVGFFLLEIQTGIIQESALELVFKLVCNVLAGLSSHWVFSTVLKDSAAFGCGELVATGFDCSLFELFPRLGLA